MLEVRLQLQVLDTLLASTPRAQSPDDSKAGRPDADIPRAATALPSASQADVWGLLAVMYPGDTTRFVELD